MDIHNDDNVGSIEIDANVYSQDYDDADIINQDASNYKTETDVQFE